MSRTARDVENIAKARRHRALARNELRVPSEPRASPAGVTSFPVKAQDEATRRIIEEFERARSAGCPQEPSFADPPFACPPD